MAVAGPAPVESPAGEVAWSRSACGAASAPDSAYPIRVARLIRFDGAAHLLSAGRAPAEVAAVTGHAGQSHLYRKVTAFTGRTPAAVAAASWPAVTALTSAHGGTARPPVWYPSVIHVGRRACPAGWRGMSGSGGAEEQWGVAVDLQLSARPGRGCTVVRVGGELDMDTRAELASVLHGVLGEGARHLVLDFTDVTFMDSSGLGLLVDVLKELRPRGGRLSLAAVREPVRNVLVLSALDQVVGVYDTVAAAETAEPPGDD